MLTRTQLDAKVSHLRANGERLDLLFCTREGNTAIFHILRTVPNPDNKEWQWAIAPSLQAKDAEMRKNNFKRVSHHKFGSIQECMVWVKE